MISTFLINIYNTISVVYVCAWAATFIIATTITFGNEVYKYKKQKYKNFKKK